MKVYVLAIMLMLMFITIDINAQYNDASPNGKIGIGPQLGYQRSGDADVGKIMYGGFIRAKLSPSLAVEGSINYRTEEYYNGKLTVRSWPVLASVLLYPFPMFYGIAGVGWYNTSFDFTPGFQQSDLKAPNKSRFGWHLGAGAEIPLAHGFTLTGDIKYVFLKYNLDNIPNLSLNDLNSNFYVINVGLLIGLN